jgi:hypothetical protein
MTILAALQAKIEYKNTDLLAKALIDQGVANSGATYTSADEQDVDLAAADIYLALLSHPSLREGSLFVDYSKGALISLRRELLRKWDKLPATVSEPRDAAGIRKW